jgi:uroporphyrinogen decarboxylase
MNKTSRERVYQSIMHKEPDQIPFTLYLSKSLQNKLQEKWGPRSNWPCPEDDTIRILWDVEVENISDVEFLDLFGCKWRRENGGYIFTEPPLLEPDASKIPRIELIREKDIQSIIQKRKNNPDKFIFYQFTACFGERLWNLRGMEEALMDYLLEPGFVHSALDMLMEMHIEALGKILKLPIDGVTFGDDFGSQRGLLISRDIFLKFFKPRYRKLYEMVRSAGKVVGHHSCGDNTLLMKDFIDIGLEVFHPLQPEAMDIVKIKHQFGGDLTFRGGIGTQGVLITGTPEAAAAEVRRSVEILAEGGGYLMETSKPLPEETPVENVMAIIQEFGKLTKN